MNKLDIAFGWILNLVLSFTWLVYEIMDYAYSGEKLQVGTIMWASLSLYISIRNTKEN